MIHDSHASVLEIDLPAVAANWRLLGARHTSGPVAGVVKADGYGLGAVKVARCLFAAGCRHFFTAHLAEAIAIRPHVPDAMVAALHPPPPGSEAAYAAHAVTPVLGSREDVARFRGPAILHVDTGMNRLGLPLAELAGLRLGGIELAYVMTHLVASEAQADPINAVQAERFAAACAALPGVKRSFANSSGIFLGPGFGSDLARPGAALCGINPTPGRANPMRPVVRLRARVLQVRAIAAGETVGYNGTWRAARASRIATVSVGYADGWLRSLSNRGHAVFDGAPVPLVGRVSMDLTTFDVTDHPAIGPGDWLDLIGPGRDADAVAADAGTNGYEILTSLGARYHRVWRA
jgi:alanine racemase